MKNKLLLASLLTACVLTPAFATDKTVAVIPADPAVALDELLDHCHVTVGQSREGVLTEMRAPNYVVGENIWVYTGFRAKNVTSGEQFDTLVVAFVNQKVATVRLAQEEQLRAALHQAGSVAAKVAQR